MRNKTTQVPIPNFIKSHIISKISFMVLFSFFHYFKFLHKIGCNASNFHPPTIREYFDFASFWIFSMEKPISPCSSFFTACLAHFGNGIVNDGLILFFYLYHETLFRFFHASCLLTDFGISCSIIAVLFGSN